MLIVDPNLHNFDRAFDFVENEFQFFSRFRNLSVANLKRIDIDTGATPDHIGRVVRNVLGGDGDPGARGPIVVGALPFSFHSQTVLFSSRSVHDDVPRPLRQAGARARLVPERIESIPPEGIFLNTVRQALEHRPSIAIQ